VEDLHHVVFECPIYSAVRDKFADLFAPYGGVCAAEQQIYTSHSLRNFMTQDQSRLAWFFYRCSVARTAVEAAPGTILFQRARRRGVAVDDLDTLSTASDSESIDDWFPYTEGMVDN
jgi:hypothetical protein